MVAEGGGRRGAGLRLHSLHGAQLDGGDAHLVCQAVSGSTNTLSAHSPPVPSSCRAARVPVVPVSSSCCPQRSPAPGTEIGLAREDLVKRRSFCSRARRGLFDLLGRRGCHWPKASMQDRARGTLPLVYWLIFLWGGGKEGQPAVLRVTPGGACGCT